MHKEESSIKTLGVVFPRRQATASTLGYPHCIIGSRYPTDELEEGSQFEINAFEVEDDLNIATLRHVGNAYQTYASIWEDMFSSVTPPNAVCDVVPNLPEGHLWAPASAIVFLGSGWSTPSSVATLNVVDKKYSEVFQVIFSLLSPEDEDDVVPAPYAYWNAMKTVGTAYHTLKLENPRLIELETPTALVDDAGGVRLIWRSTGKLVKANFGGKSDLKSYLYYESGQVYDVETLDAPTLARRLGWLI